MKNSLEKFSDVKVLVVGDIMHDRYLWGSVSRISPEAPVPVVKLNKETTVAGGAANVAVNISGLGATPSLISVIGNDIDGEKFPNILTRQNVSADKILKLNRPTTVKTRIVAQNQQIVRLDQELSDPLTEDEEQRVWKEIENCINGVDVILISDYAKGVVTENLTNRLIEAAKKSNKIVIVDPKGKTYKKYSSATILTPNKKEAFEAIDVEDDGEVNINDVGYKLLETFGLEALLITRGNEGMTLFEHDKSPLNLKASARKVYDVTGAGDTVIATLAVAIGAGWSFADAAELANTAAGIVVEEMGTSAISLENLQKEIKENS